MVSFSPLPSVSCTSSLSIAAIIPPTPLIRWSWAKELSQINFSKFTLLLYDIYARGLMVCMGRPNRLGERQISRAHRYPPFLKLCPLGREHDGPLCQMQRSSLHYGTNTRLCAL